MSEIPLNKYEKEKRVIELHLTGKTIRERNRQRTSHVIYLYIKDNKSI